VIRWWYRMSVWRLLSFICRHPLRLALSGTAKEKQLAPSGTAGLCFGYAAFRSRFLPVISSSSKIGFAAAQRFGGTKRAPSENAPFGTWEQPSLASSGSVPRQSRGQNGETT
jgi:hypothetical protein